jgi:uncharacterized repeat protein (TIGR03803 family)
MRCLFYEPLHSNNFKMKKMKKFITIIALAFCIGANAQVDTLRSFNTANGASPNGSLISVGSYLYGMTKAGGTNNYGNIFKIKPDGTGLDTLVNFNNSNGASPNGSLISDGTYLYGMTTYGGSSNKGTIFKIKPDGTSFTTLKSFLGSTAGSLPYGSLMLLNDTLYGMTFNGGASGFGNIFKIKTDGTGYSNLYSFNFSGSSGYYPLGSLVTDGTYLFGMIPSGGVFNQGTVFKIKTDGTSFTVLTGFDASGSLGSAPQSSLLLLGTTLYGMTAVGGATSNGNVFKINTDGTSLNSLISFNGTNGSSPYGTLIYDGTAYLCGMTASAGSYGNIFKIKPDGTGFVDLVHFNVSNGRRPVSDLILQGDHLFGMTSQGGPSNVGTIFDFCYSPPTIAVTSATVCAGSTATLTASGASTYTWNTGATTPSITVTPTNDTTYTVIGANGSCVSTSMTATVTVKPEVAGATYLPLALTGFNQDIVANGTDYTTTTTTSVDANSDGCRFIDTTYTQFGIPTRFLPTGGAFNSQTTPNVPFQFASYTANNSLTLQTGSMSGTLTLTTPTMMNQFYLLATSGGGVTNIDFVINFEDGSSQSITSFNIDDWFNGPSYALRGVGRMYASALGFQAPTDINPRIYQYLIDISAANQSKKVISIAFTRNNTGPMKTQIMGITAHVSIQNFCISSNPTVADLTANGSNIQWYDNSNVLLTNTESLADGNLYTVTQTVNGCASQADTVLVSINALPIVTTTSYPTIATVCIGSQLTLAGTGASTYVWSNSVTDSIAFTPSVSGTYTVTGTDGNGCTNTATQVVTVNPLPTVTAAVNPANDTVCAGSQVTLAGVGASTYVWSNSVIDNLAFTPSASGTYTVTGTDGNGCTSTATQVVTVNPLPVLTTTLAGVIITATETAATYQWINCADNTAIVGATGQTYTATVNGSYAVVVTKNTCSDTSSCVSVTTAGISPIVNHRSQIIIYPNPNNGAFTMNAASEGIYTIQNELGQTIQSVKLNSTNNFTVNIDNLSNGIYFVTGFNNEIITRQKIVVTK